MRVHLLAQTTRKITESTYFRLGSFSDEDKIQYLTKYWNSYIARYRESTNTWVPTQEQLIEFARRCTEIKIPEEFQDVLGVPLQCRMIAEIHAENMLNRNFSLDIDDFGNVTKYSEKYFDSKCKIYFKDKHKMSGGNLINSPMFKEKKKQMYTLHIYYALKLFHRDFKCVVLFQETLLPQFDKDTEKDLLNFGVIKTLKPLEFMHLLIPQYFVALFYKEFAKKDGIYHSKFTDYRQKYLLFSSMLRQYVTGLAGYDKSMVKQSFELRHPNVFKLLKCLSEEQSKSVVNPGHVYPVFCYTAVIDKELLCDFKDFTLQENPNIINHSTFSQECELKFIESLGYYLKDYTRFGYLVYRQGFKIDRPNVLEDLRYLSEEVSNFEDVYPLGLYHLENVTLQEYHERGLIPDVVYVKIIEMLNVVQRLSSICRIFIDVIENDKNWNFHVHVEHID